MNLIIYNIEVEDDEDRDSICNFTFPLLVAGIFEAAAENDTVNNTTDLKNASKAPLFSPFHLVYQ